VKIQLVFPQAGTTMSSTNLISLERARLNLPNASTSDERTIDAMIAAASDGIEAYCKRRFALGQYDELYDGAGHLRLFLREYPIHSVQSVRTNYQTVLTIENIDTSTNQRATVAVMRTGLRLVRVASGTVAQDTSVTWSSNATIDAVVSAVNALSNGWSAQRIGDADDFGKWASQDLWVAPSFGDGEESYGAVDCRGRPAGLKLHTRELSDYSWDRRGWLVRANSLTDAALFWGEEPTFPAGVHNFRVQYTAGYREIPGALQEACALWVAILFERTRRDPALAVKQIPGSISETFRQFTTHHPPPEVAAMLAPYRRHPISC
jgi:hypothetical protein